MAKKKVLQQLNLFGDLFATQSEEVKQTTTHNDNTVKDNVETSVTTSEVIMNSDEIHEKNSEPQIIFSNSLIGVKIKPKKTITTVNEEHVVIASSPKIEKQKNLQERRGRKSFRAMDDEAALVNIPPDEELKKKLYYSIGEVASFFNVTTSLIRAWEIEFDVLKPRKNRKGDRLFRFEDIKNLQVIYYLLRNRKFSIDGAKKYLKENKTNINNSIQLTQTLQNFKNFLLEIKPLFNE
jgi:DNA-binding transcriptional MerR regulator